MAFSIQQLTDDNNLSHALRFEVLKQVCLRELVSDLLIRCHAWESVSAASTSSCWSIT